MKNKGEKNVGMLCIWSVRVSGISALNRTSALNNMQKHSSFFVWTSSFFLSPSACSDAERVSVSPDLSETAF